MSLVSDPAPRPVEGAVIGSLLDTILDRTVVAGYTSAGYRIRSRAWDADDLPSMDGKTVLVTGATSGLGLAAAEGFARLGARVRLLARSEERGERARAAVVAATGNRDVRVYLCDVSDLQRRAGLRGALHRRRAAPRRAGQQRRRAAARAGGLRGRQRARACDERARTVPAHEPADPPAHGERSGAGHHRLLGRDVHAAARMSRTCSRRARSSTDRRCTRGPSARR